MNSSNNMRALILGAFLAIVVAEAPLGPYPAATPIYAPPRIEVLPAPYPPAISAPYPAAIPAPVYGVPKVHLPTPQVVTSYGYKLYTPKRVEVLAPYPAKVLTTGPYPAPVPVIPTPVYGPPRVEIIKPIAPVATSYNYDLPHYVPKVLPYAPPTPVYGLPKFEVIPAPLPLPKPVVVAPYPPAVAPYPPAVPHSEYGLQF